MKQVVEFFLNIGSLEIMSQTYITCTTKNAPENTAQLFKNPDRAFKEFYWKEVIQQIDLESTMAGQHGDNPGHWDLL